jgi:hypothetical protein
MDETALSGLFSGMGGASTLAGLYSLLSGSNTSNITNQASGNANQYGSQLNNLLTNPSSFALSPAAQTQIDTGTQNLERSAAAQGFMGSGNLLAGLQQNAQGIASQDYNTQVSTLANLMQGQQSTGLNAANQQNQQRTSAMQELGGGLGMLGSSGGLSGLMSLLGLGGASTSSSFGGLGGLGASTGDLSAGGAAGNLDWSSSAPSVTDEDLDASTSAVPSDIGDLFG